MRTCMVVAALGFGFSLLSACSTTVDTAPPTDEPPTKPAPQVLPELTEAVTTTSATFSLKVTRSNASGPNPARPENLASYLERGFGDLVSGPGESHIARTIDGSPAPALGPNAKRLVRFVHLADWQLADDESPARVGNFDSPGETSAALRPQDALLCRLANSSVRTINALHRADPISFVLLGGDNADSAQDNEVSWVLDILDGSSSVECDSGADDDPTPGSGNDGKDPFVAEGLLMPWKWVTGNHDVLVQGNFAVDDSRSETAVGSRSAVGTRDYTQGGAIVSGDVIPDPKRALLRRPALMTKIAASKDGHGIGEAQKQSGKAYYTFDVPNTPLRFVVLDTSAETGGGSGLIHQADVDSFVKPALDQAKQEGKWVVLSSHQATDNLSLDGGSFGTKQADAVTPAAWRTFIGGYDNVLFGLHGHYHTHHAQPIAPATGHAWWEVITASIADYPHQFRTIEIWDGDNGWAMLRATAVDLALTGDALAAEGRKLGVVDYASGWNPGDGTGKKEGRNVELWIKKPGG